MDCKDHPGDKTSLFFLFSLLNEVFPLNHIHSQEPCRGWGLGKACETTAVMSFSPSYYSTAGGVLQRILIKSSYVFKIGICGQWSWMHLGGMMRSCMAVWTAAVPVLRGDHSPAASQKSQGELQNHIRLGSYGILLLPFGFSFLNRISSTFLIFFPTMCFS